MGLKSFFNKLVGKKTVDTAPAQPQAEKYYVRFSRAEDLDKINQFYDLNAHKSVRKRASEIVEKLVNEGAIVLIEDTKGELVASSITYAHSVKDAAGNNHVKWQEFGTTRVVLNGFPGLFDAMVTLQMLRTFLVEPPEDKFVAQMHTIPVQNMAKKLGWRSYEPSEELKESKKQTVSTIDQQNAAPDINWFFCGMEVLPTMAQYMVTTIENPILENKKTGARIELDFSRSTFFTMFEKEIKALAKQNLGDLEHPDMNRGVAEARNKWMKNFFR